VYLASEVIDVTNMRKEEYSIIVVFRVLISSLFFGAGELVGTPWIISAIVLLLGTIVELAYGERFVDWILAKTRKN